MARIAKFQGNSIDQQAVDQLESLYYIYYNWSEFCDDPKFAKY